MNEFSTCSELLTKDAMFVIGIPDLVFQALGFVGWTICARLSVQSLLSDTTTALTVAQ